MPHRETKGKTGDLKSRNDRKSISDSKVDEISKDIVLKGNKDVKGQLQSVKESIDIARDRLNKIISQNKESHLTSEEIIEASQQLDLLIQLYNSMSIEIQEIKNKTITNNDL